MYIIKTQYYYIKNTNEDTTTIDTAWLVFFI
jgi:hypothetical protein